MKPAVSSRRLISRKGRGLSRPNLNLDGANLRWAGCLRWLEVEFQSFLEVGERLFFGFTLAGYVELQALRYIPVAFSPDGSGERTLHD